MLPEAEARQHIDQLLQLAGWNVQDFKKLNLGASLGVAVREFPTEVGPADYMLFVEKQPVGVIEAKPVGTPSASLRGVFVPPNRHLEVGPFPVSA